MTERVPEETNDSGREPSQGLLVPLRSTLSKLDAFSGQLVAVEEISQDPQTAFGAFVAKGPRASDPREYAELIEAIHEGFLSHYGTPRVLRRGIDEDLALLAGDYLYALGLEQLAALGNTAAVAELSDLISLQALLHSDGHPESPGEESLIRSLWMSTLVAVACGGSKEFAALKAEIPAASDPEGLAERLRAWADARVIEAGVGEAWAQVPEQVGFDSSVN